MKKILIPAVACAAALMMLLSGCSSGKIGGQVKGESYRSADRGYPSAAPSKAKRSIEGASGMSDYDASDSYAAEESSSDAAPSSDGGNSAAQKPSDDESVIIYEADCSIAVRSVKDAVLSVELVGKEYGARIESVRTNQGYQSAQISVRVPVKNFERFIRDLSRVGRVDSTSVSATNVSDEFRDLGLRLQSSEKVRTRLYELLKKETNVSGRIAILREIDRVSSKIETIKARMEYLKSLADYSTVRISLTAERKDTVKKYIPSPFEWIRNLSPAGRSMSKAADIDADIPKGYFSLVKNFKKENGRYMYVSPGDSVGIRACVTDNYPQAKLGFWESALDFDAVNMLYKQLSSSKVKGADGIEYVMRSWKVTGEGRYAVAFTVRDDEILVIESYFTDAKSYETEYAAFETFVKSVRWK